MTSKITILPTVPPDYEPEIGRLYNITFYDFYICCKRQSSTWKDRNAVEGVTTKVFEEDRIISKLLFENKAVMLLLSGFFDDTGIITGSILVGKEILDYRIFVNEHESCLEVWQRTFRPAIL
jgi:hypothetical protein